MGLRAGWAQASVDSGCGLYESGPGESCHRPLATHAGAARLDKVLISFLAAHPTPVIVEDCVLSVA